MVVSSECWTEWNERESSPAGTHETFHDAMPVGATDEGKARSNALCVRRNGPGRARVRRARLVEAAGMAEAVFSGAFTVALSDQHATTCDEYS